MNTIRGSHDPIAQAQLIVDLEKSVQRSELMKHLGFTPLEYQSSVAILNQPERPEMTLKKDEEPPVKVTIMLTKQQGISYEAALDKALSVLQRSDENVVVLDQEDVALYDAAMRRVIKLYHIEQRSSALALMCEAFLSMPTEDLYDKFPPKKKKS